MVKVTNAASAAAVNGPAAARLGNLVAAPELLLRIVSPMNRSMAELLVVVVIACVVPEAGTAVIPAAVAPSCTVSVELLVNPDVVRAMVAVGVADVVIPENAGVILYDVA